MNAIPAVAGRALLAAALAATSAASSASARDLDLGVPDLELRFDNTFRYNVGVRTDPIDRRIGATPAFTAGEYGVRQGGLTTSRLDLLSEVDLSYRGSLGVRLSGTAWYDYAYQDGSTSRSPAIATPGTYVGGDLSTYALRRYRGPWGEVLDAFAFATIDAGSVPVTVKAGRHTVYWGESLMLAGAIHGVSYSQMPLDLAKGFATPGIEAKELFRPLGGLSAQAQLTPTLSVVGQVLFEWQSYVYPEGGTFLGPADFAFNGPDGVYRRMGPNDVFLANGGVSRPSDLGDFGAAVRWRPEWLDGTAGIYFRRYTDKLGAVLLTGNPGGVGPMSPAMPSPFQYRQYYGEGVDLFGLSLAKQLLGVSFGAEASYRRNTPLAAQMLGFAVPRPAPAPPQDPVLFPHGPPSLDGNTYQARGDTVHGLVNAIGVVSGGPAFPTASWALEVTYSRWLEVRSNPDMFFGLGYGVCRGDPALSAATPSLAKGKGDGCATRDAVAVGAGFTPTWFRVLSGVDLLLPLNASWTVRGNSPVTLGGNEGSGTYGAGIAADIRNRYRVDLRYADFFGRTVDDGTVVTSANGLLALLKSRGSVTLTAKATF
jgi:uncharacterized protein DUF1302